MEQPARKQLQGTVKPHPSFDGSMDAQMIMKGLKTSDEVALIGILTHRSNTQRQQIKEHFQTMFGKELEQALCEHLSGYQLHVLRGLLDQPLVFYARQLHRAIDAAVVDGGALIEILCLLSNSQIAAVKTVFKQRYQRDFEMDIKNNTSGDFKRLLLSVCAGNRDESSEVDVNRAMQDAQALYNAGEKKLGTDEKVFIEIFSSRNRKNLRAIDEEYKKISKKTLEQAIKSETSGDLCRGLTAMLRAAKSVQEYLASRLQESMKGAGTTDSTLIRIIVSRCEVDMVQIINAFHRLYGNDLKEWIADDTSGTYRQTLLALVAPDSTNTK